MTPHRIALNPLNGQLWAAERFAIDYVQLLPDGRLFNGDKTKPESYPGFGADIHAVADGQVVAVVDGLPEQVPGQNPTGLPLEQYAGNHIVQVIGRWQLCALRPPQNRQYQSEGRATSLARGR